MRELTVAHLVDYRSARLADGIGPSSVNGEVATFRRMLCWAKTHGMIASNPLAEFKRLSVDQPRKERRALTPDEAQRLFDASPPHMRNVWLTFLSTGLRRNELTEMRFDDIDFENRTVLIRRQTAKTHRSRHVPLSDEVLVFIRRLQQDAPFRHPVDGPTPAMTRRQHHLFTKDHVFVTLANTPLRNVLLTRFYECTRRAGISDAARGGSIDLHSLRVTFISMAMNAGAKPKAVSMVVGHSRLTVTLDVYTKCSAVKMGGVGRK